MKIEELREIASKLQSFNIDGSNCADHMDIKSAGDLLFLSADKIEKLQDLIDALEAENAKLRVAAEIQWLRSIIEKLIADEHPTQYNVSYDKAGEEK